MLKMRELKVSNDTVFNFVGLDLRREQRLKIKERLEVLREKSPANSHIRLFLEKRKDSYVGELSIKSVSKSIKSRKASHDPFQTLLLLEKEAEEQLLEWKLSRFNLTNSLTGMYKTLDKYG